MSILRPVIKRNKHSCLYVKSLTICSSCGSFYGANKTMCCFFKGTICRSSFFLQFLLPESVKHSSKTEVRQCLA